MDEKQNSPLLLKYLKLYEKDSKSRVFAPLAEHYRRIGMIEEAIKILHKGISYNPTYINGYVGLASCYFDQGKYSESYNTLRPLVEDNRDNIRLLKLFVRTCIEAGNDEEALDTAKYLLFINPKDSEMAIMVAHIENHSSGQIILPRNELGIEGLENNIDELPDAWVQVDLFKGGKRIIRTKEPKEIQELPIEIEKVSSTILPDISELDNNPVVTHTLIDLYITQGYKEKAKRNLEELLDKNPHDIRAIKKLESLTPQIKSGNGDEGQNKLMELYDKKIGSKNSKKQSIVESKLISFLEAIKNRANTISLKTKQI
jgi:tetratricopeptide (TPR) repeat protein